MKYSNWDIFWLKQRHANIKKIKHFFRVFKFYDFVLPDKKIIDVGCGTGDALYLLKEKGYEHLEGIEPEEKLFKDFDRFKMIREGSCLNIGMGGRRYDVVLMFGVLHHLNDLDEMKLTLENVRRILNVGGRFYSVEPWKNPVRVLATKLLLETPLANLNSYLRAESKIWVCEKKNFSNWLKVERMFTDHASKSGFDVSFHKRDLRYRYIVFKKVY